MQKDDSWPEECIRKAQRSHPAVNESVSRRLRALIQDQGERILHGQELAGVAKALLSDMAVAPLPKGGEEA
jgi:hypothetical protein